MLCSKLVLLCPYHLFFYQRILPSIGRVARASCNGQIVYKMPALTRATLPTTLSSKSSSLGILYTHYMILSSTLQGSTLRQLAERKKALFLGLFCSTRKITNLKSALRAAKDPRLTLFILVIFLVYVASEWLLRLWLFP